MIRRCLPSDTQLRCGYGSPRDPFPNLHRSEWRASFFRPVLLHIAGLVSWVPLGYRRMRFTPSQRAGRGSFTCLDRMLTATAMSGRFLTARYRTDPIALRYGTAFIWLTSSSVRGCFIVRDTGSVMKVGVGLHSSIPNRSSTLFPYDVCVSLTLDESLSILTPRSTRPRRGP
jgi:hypothetical protein